jgi:hypothetical protein
MGHDADLNEHFDFSGQFWMTVVVRNWETEEETKHSYSLDSQGNFVFERSSNEGVETEVSEIRSWVMEAIGKLSLQAFRRKIFWSHYPLRWFNPLTSVSIETSKELEICLINEGLEVTSFLNFEDGNLGEPIHESYLRNQLIDKNSDGNLGEVKRKWRLLRDRSLTVNGQEWLLLPSINGAFALPSSEFLAIVEPSEKETLLPFFEWQGSALRIEIFGLKESRSLVWMKSRTAVWSLIRGNPGHTLAIFLTHRIHQMIEHYEIKDPEFTHALWASEIIDDVRTFLELARLDESDITFESDQRSIKLRLGSREKRGWAKHWNEQDELSYDWEKEFYLLLSRLDWSEKFVSQVDTCITDRLIHTETSVTEGAFHGSGSIVTGSEWDNGGASGAYWDVVENYELRIRFFLDDWNVDYLIGENHFFGAFKRTDYHLIDVLLYIQRDGHLEINLELLDGGSTSLTYHEKFMDSSQNRLEINLKESWVDDERDWFLR